MILDPANDQNNGHRNLSADELDLAARLRALRLAAGLSRQDLADRAGLSERSVRDIENGRRHRVQDKTVMLLAEALGCEPADLARLPEVPPAEVRRRRLRWIVPVGAVVMAVLALLVWQIAIAQGRWEIVDGDLVMRDGLLHRVMWRIDQQPRVNVVAESPWDDGTLLVGFNNLASDGAQVWRVRRSTGERLTSYTMDEEPVRAAFGDKILAEGQPFYCGRIRFMDLDGDGTRELVIQYTHGKYYPAAVAAYDADGAPLAQYVNRGHIDALFIDDIDDDGRDELLALGTNNDPVYQGATVIYLEEGAWTGAAVDPPQGPGRGPVGDIVDGARYRLVLPTFDAPVMAQLERVRITAQGARTHAGNNGSVHIAFYAGLREYAGISVTCDDHLRPQSATATDTMRGIVSHWPAPFGEPGEFPSEPWLDTWLEKARWTSLESDEVVFGPAR